MRVSRRALLLSAGAAALEATLPFRRSFAASEIKEYRLTAKAATVNLTGDGHPDTAVWAYGGTVPGPEVRIRQGDAVRLVVSNKLGEDTTVHWHGIRLPNAMDGVPGLTQPPIRPGESFTYEFTPPDAGTFWYHPHADSLQQLGRGLAGALIVEEREPVGVDRDLLWFIEDWRLDDGGRIAPGFGNRMEAGMSGRIGNTVTVNGRVPETVSVRAGERLRLRIVESSSVSFGQRWLQLISVLLLLMSRLRSRGGTVGGNFVQLVLIFQLHEIGDVEEGVAFQPNVHECGLHAGQDAGYAASVDGTCQGVFVFTFQIDFCQLVVFH